ncbi:Protein EXORDIUM-like 3 [Striga hermonthica]|uniref:Protein EXORDIUM-like 3 n=1 Tax=Striga hermonthica TaxID=68872 RepID=A0A9N7NKL9_STRHE|nr:Protein EXORDIUM-like 3 [Striga hermonthica]
MSPPPPFAAALTLILLLPGPALSWRPWPNATHPNSTNLLYGGSKRFEGSSDLVHLDYHMGPVLTSEITVHPIWYGAWQNRQKRIIREFIASISPSAASKPPSVAGWWGTVRLYTDQTGANISRSVRLGREKSDRFYSHGRSLTRLDVQSVIRSAVAARTQPLPINPGGVYLVLTSGDVYVRDFCTAACGFHYFTFPSIVGYTLPYAWVGNSARMCPGVCAYPFAVPEYMTGVKPVRAPNSDVGVDGMITVIAHELAELSTNPFINAWYAGRDPIAPVEIADLCEGIYGSGGGGSYTGQLLKGEDGATYNMNGIRRRYLVQWVWDPILSYCRGPNALD